MAGEWALTASIAALATGSIRGMLEAKRQGRPLVTELRDGADARERRRTLGIGIRGLWNGLAQGGVIMRRLYTAIIHVRDSMGPAVREATEHDLRVTRGVLDVSVVPRESLVTVSFDGEQTGLADLVRLLEDSGLVVSGVAQRHAPVRHAVA